MAGRVVKLAVAGSGKTYSLCQDVLDQEKTLILAFTHANIHNIVRELLKKQSGGKIPDKTSVMTFDSFVYRYAVSPYVKTIARHFGCENRRLGGVTNVKPPMRKQRTPRGWVDKPMYVKSDIRHYVDKRGQFYLDTLCELVMFVKKGRRSLIKDVAVAVKMFWSRVLVDEFQDFREFDYEFLVGMLKNHENVTLVGDYYQHSVAANGNSGKPFAKGKNEIPYDEFVQGLRTERFEVDETSLKCSRRCPPEICEFVCQKLGVRMSSSSSRIGHVIWVREDALADKLIADNRIMKLVYENSRKMPYLANNWSYSKGDTYGNVCVILGGTTDSLDKDYPQSRPKSFIVANKLYVALTRAVGDLYVMRSDVYRRWKERNVQ